MVTSDGSLVSSKHRRWRRKRGEGRREGGKGGEGGGQGKDVGQAYQTETRQREREGGGDKEETWDRHIGLRQDKAGNKN